jgi:hypothetical protein
MPWAGAEAWPPALQVPSGHRGQQRGTSGDFCHGVPQVGKIFQRGRLDQPIAVGIPHGQRQPDHSVCPLPPGIRVTVSGRVCKQLLLQQRIPRQLAVTDPRGVLTVSTRDGRNSRSCPAIAGGQTRRSSAICAGRCRRAHSGGWYRPSERSRYDPIGTAALGSRRPGKISDSCTQRPQSSDAKYQSASDSVTAMMHPRHSPSGESSASKRQRRQVPGRLYFLERH